ncbi:CopD family protein [Qipengyuania flava]|uniref:CopD family protein n=1 Tax=Qipengyuania flava TaxID=192812 RepID=UPI001CD1D704|nr:CopD family protein [Qipengyuania flava]MCA0891800.1 CopD family protein [Qipengyuania flava]
MDSYSVVKVLHLTAISVFVGALFAQVRLVRSVEHGTVDVRKAVIDSVARLDVAVTIPALAISWAMGLVLIVMGSWFPASWLLAKLAVVIFLSGTHAYISGILVRLREIGDPPPALLKLETLILLSVLAIVGFAIAKSL